MNGAVDVTEANSHLSMARPRGQRAHQAMLPRTSPLRPPMLLASIAVMAAAVAGARCSGVVKLSNPEGQVSDGSATTDYSKRPFIAQGLVQGRDSTPCDGTEAGVGCEQSDGWKFFRHGKGAIDALGYTNTYSYDLCAAQPDMCYASDMYCAWEINVPGPARVELTVEAYHIEPQLDTFRIYEGVPLYTEVNGVIAVSYAHTASMEDLSCVGCDAWGLETMGPSFRPAGIGTTSGSIIGAGFARAPRKIVVNSHAAFLYFHSDSSGVYPGFTLSYRTLPVLCKPGFWIPIVRRVGKKYTWSSTVRSMGNDCYPCSSSCGDAFSCPLGSSANVTGDQGSSCALCKAGNFGAPSQLQYTTETCAGPCPAGQACFSQAKPVLISSTVPVNCEPGTFSAGGATACELCDAGYFCRGRSVSATGKADATAMDTPCGPGRYGNAGATNDMCSGECRAGYFCPAGSSSSTANMCGRRLNGVFCPPGSSEAQLVPDGKLAIGGVDSRTRTDIADCPPGAFCVGDTQTGCPEGKYVAEAGAASVVACKSCPNGFRCQLSGAGREGKIGSASGKSVSCAPDDSAQPERWYCIGGIRYVIPSRDTTTYSTPQDGPRFSRSGFSTISTADEGVKVVFGILYKACPPGSSRQNETASCTICPAGTFKATSDDAPCALCACSTFSAPAATSCDGTCADGSFGNIATSTCEKCGPCTTGVRMQCSGSNAGFCSSCPAGKFFLQDKKKTCEDCPAGSWCQSGKQFACGSINLFCPANSANPTSVAIGHYSVPTNASEEHRTGQNSCEAGFSCAKGVQQACPPGRVCQVSTVQARVFNAVGQTVVVNVTTESLCAENQFVYDGACVDCPPTGADCADGIIKLQLEHWYSPDYGSLKEFWGKRSKNEIPSHTDIYRCMADACTTKNGLPACLEGRKGTLCAVCEDGYFITDQRACKKCPESASVDKTLWALVTVIVLCGALWSAKRKIEQKHPKLALSMKEKLPEVLKLLTGLAQILGSFAVVLYRVPWPEAFTDVMSLFSVVRRPPWRRCARLPRATASATAQHAHHPPLPLLCVAKFGCVRAAVHPLLRHCLDLLRAVSIARLVLLGHHRNFCSAAFLRVFQGQHRARKARQDVHGLEHLPAVSVPHLPQHFEDRHPHAALPHHQRCALPAERHLGLVRVGGVRQILVLRRLWCVRLPHWHRRLLHGSRRHEARQAATRLVARPREGDGGQQLRGVLFPMQRQRQYQ